MNQDKIIYKCNNCSRILSTKYNYLAHVEKCKDKTICKVENCNRCAVFKCDNCWFHGGIKRCKHSECYNCAQSPSDYCISHGGGRRCKHTGCTNSARTPSDYCTSHGGGRRCKHTGCSNGAVSSTDYCRSHGGGRRCKHTGCTNSAQFPTDYCMSHGHIKRCKHSECYKCAVFPTDYCVSHGGGRRCKHTECTSSAVYPTDYCVSHGGGKRCKHTGCTNSALSSGYCKSHGGGKRCKHTGCTNSASSPSDYCRSHGGGPRCEHPDHIITEFEPHPPSAYFKLDGIRLCHAHYHLQPNGNSCKAIRKEVLLLGAIFTKCYRHLELNESYIGHDFSIKSCKLLRRPDMLFMFENFALLIECDENGHKDRKIIEEEEHLMVIKQWISDKYNRSRLLQVRINPDGKKPMFKKLKDANREQIWKITSEGETKIDEVLSSITDIIDCGLDNTDPEFIFKDAIDDIAIRKFFF